MRTRILVSAVLFVLVAAGCSSDDVHVARGGHGQSDHHGDPAPGVVHGGPPAHAPAHGYRKKFQYRYYADHRVYHAADRGLYFWLEGDDWRFGVELPSHIVLETSMGVVVELASDSPYDHYLTQKYDGRPKHHPGKGKAKGKNKGKAAAKARGW